MILVDANLLLYAYNASSEHHERARVWLEDAIAQPQPFGLAWETVLAFLRISTNTRAFEHPLLIAEAVAIVSEWLAQPTTTMLEPGGRHWNILSSLLTTAQAFGPLVMDAHLAALAIEHGAVLYTNDRDFSRFQGLQTRNPLETSS
ncbi:MAG: type II toxin-antitoxin system VapC family toxin [Acidobacteria bacterium]|nr:type II toxin-antitoxin system VapC family toxin [Acidobacteriota bacterium]